MTDAPVDMVEGVLGTEVMGVVQERLPPDQAFGIFLATFLKRKYFKR